MSKKTRERRAKRARRIERRNLRIAETRAELKRNAHAIVHAIYASRPVGMIAWNEYPGDRSGRSAVVGYMEEPSPFDRVLYSREFSNAQLRVVIVENSELKGIQIDTVDPNSVLLPRVFFYSEGHATSMDVNPTAYQLEGVILN